MPTIDSILWASEKSAIEALWREEVENVVNVFSKELLTEML